MMSTEAHECRFFSDFRIDKLFCNGLPYSHTSLYLTTAEVKKEATDQGRGPEDVDCSQDGTNDSSYYFPWTYTLGITTTSDYLSVHNI